ncbi:MAG: SRPBCC family protein [Blastococcus sp.]
MTDIRSVTVDQFVAAPRERVWAALTEPDLLARWWVGGDIAPIVGHRFTLQMGQWGEIPCEMVEVREPELLVYTFNTSWTLTWELVAEGNGTRLLLEHAGFDLDDPQGRYAFENMGIGWRDAVLPRLATVLAEQGSPTVPH